MRSMAPSRVSLAGRSDTTASKLELKSPCEKELQLVFFHPTDTDRDLSDAVFQESLVGVVETPSDFGLLDAQSHQWWLPLLIMEQVPKRGPSSLRIGITIRLCTLVVAGLYACIKAHSWKLLPPRLKPCRQGGRIFYSFVAHPARLLPLTLLPTQRLPSQEKLVEGPRTRPAVSSTDISEASFHQ